MLRADCCRELFSDPECSVQRFGRYMGRVIGRFRDRLLVRMMESMVEERHLRNVVTPADELTEFILDANLLLSMHGDLEVSNRAGP